MKHLIKILFAVGLLLSCTHKSAEFKTSGLILGIDARGRIIGLSDPVTGRNYLPGKQAAPLMQIRKQNVYYPPSRMSVKPDNGTVLLEFPTGNQATLRVTEKPTHLVFTLAEITGADSVELAVWGPYPTSIGMTIGETVGLVRDSSYAIGIQSLNPKTLGGYPTEESDTDPGYDIFETNSLIDTADSIKVFYRGQTARKEPFGSVLQAYCRNRNRERIISNWDHDYYTAPAFEDGGLSGSSIALFGCKPSDALAVIGAIELAEGLPHPMLDGEWGKTARGATAAYLIMNFGVKDFSEALELTKKAGLKYLYHEGPFETWGHFKLNPAQFPDNWATMKRMVDRAARDKIRIGAHTLSNFITTNDPYVTPVPDPRLARVGSSTLVKAVHGRESSIEIADPKFFNQMRNNTLRAAVVGKEIVQYEKVSSAPPWTLLGCKRGVFGTKAAEHQPGAVIGKLMDHGYKTFLTDNALSEEVSLRIADFFNRTGCRQISFDGLEGNWSTGMGQYGQQRFTHTWYDHLEPGLQGQVITDASTPGHFFWHTFTRMNWGEPWYAGFRESQTRYRLLNQLYFQRNLIPAMLGWFRMTPETSLEDMEWLLARSAGFNAGYGLVTSLEAVKLNGSSEKILSAIREWERVRMTGAFPDEVRKRMQDIDNEFHLEKYGPDSWTLYPYTVWRAEYKPGTGVLPVKITNDNPDQSVQFILSSGPANEATAIKLYIDDETGARIPLDLPADHHIKYTGGSVVHLFDANWRLVKTGRLNPSGMKMTRGSHTLRFEAVFTAHGPKQGIKIELKTTGLPQRIAINGR